MQNQKCFVFVLSTKFIHGVDNTPIRANQFPDSINVFANYVFARSWSKAAITNVAPLFSTSIRNWEGDHIADFVINTHISE